MKFHDELNPVIWDKDNDNQMRPEVLAKLKEIANAFIEYIEIPEDAILDMVITGSSASYNYNEFSDLDLHIIVDYDKIHEDCPLVEGYLGALKNTFNKEHDIYIHGVPVELYAEKKDQGTVHNGLYSLQTGWIDFPEKIEPTDNDAAVEAKYQEIKEMVDKCDDSETATELLEKIYNMRKAGLAEAGEFCTENLAFKKLRNEGCMDKLRQIKKEQIDRQLSLESYNESLEQDVKELTKTDDYYKVDGSRVSIKNGFGSQVELMDLQNLGKKLEKKGYKVYYSNYYIDSKKNESIKESLQDDVQEALSLIEEGMSHLVFDYNYAKFEKKFDKIREMKQPKAQLKRAKDLLLDIQGRLIDEQYDEYNEKVDALLFKKNESIKESENNYIYGKDLQKEHSYIAVNPKLSEYGWGSEDFTEKELQELEPYMSYKSKGNNFLFYLKDNTKLTYKGRYRGYDSIKMAVEDTGVILEMKFDDKFKEVDCESLNEGQSIKKWAESMLPEIYKILRKNQIPSKGYCILGHVEISPFARFVVRNQDVDKVLELLPMAKANKGYNGIYKDATSFDIEYDGLKKLEKTIKSKNEEKEMNKEKNLYVDFINEPFVQEHLWNSAKARLADEPDAKIGSTNIDIDRMISLFTDKLSPEEYKEFNVDTAENYLLDEMNKIESDLGFKPDLDEDLATLEKKMDNAEKDLQDMISKLKGTTNEELITNLDTVIKKALDEEVEIDSHKFTFKVTDTNIQLKSDWYETIIDIDGELDQTQLKSDIEDTLDFESTDFFEGEGEITGTEIVGFKYNEDTKEGEFEFNIFFE